MMEAKEVLEEEEEEKEKQGRIGDGDDVKRKKKGETLTKTTTTTPTKKKKKKKKIIGEEAVVEGNVQDSSNEIEEPKVVVNDKTLPEVVVESEQQPVKKNNLKTTTTKKRQSNTNNNLIDTDNERPKRLTSITKVKINSLTASTTTSSSSKRLSWNVPNDFDLNDLELNSNSTPPASFVPSRIKHLREGSLISDHTRSITSGSFDSYGATRLSSYENTSDMSEVDSSVSPTTVHDRKSASQNTLETRDTLISEELEQGDVEGEAIVQVIVDDYQTPHHRTGSSNSISLSIPPHRQRSNTASLDEVLNIGGREEERGIDSDTNSSASPILRRNSSAFEDRLTSKHEDTRGRIIREIIQTEKVYSWQLAEFFNVYYSSIGLCDTPVKQEFMLRPNLSGLCSNIEQISHLSQQLLKELVDACEAVVREDEFKKQRKGSFTESRSSAPSVGSNKMETDLDSAMKRLLYPPDVCARAPVGPIFQRLATLLSLYEQYAENHSFSKRDIRDFIQNQEFKKFWYACWATHLEKRVFMKSPLQQVILSGDTVSANAAANIASASNASGAGNLETSGNATSSLRRHGSVVSALRRTTMISSLTQNGTKELTKNGISVLQNSKPATPLDNYLILPIQRIPRYVLLLKELLKSTSKMQEDIDNELLSQVEIPPELLKKGSLVAKEISDIKQALVSVSNAASRMNEAIRNSEQNEQLRELQSKFEGGAVDLVGLSSDGTGHQRTLIREGELKRVTQRGIHKVFYFHLFSDAIIYSVPGKSSYHFHRALPIDGQSSIKPIKVPQQWLPEYKAFTDEKGLDLSLAFKVTTSSKSLVVYAKSKDVYSKWMKDIRKAIYEIQQRIRLSGETEVPVYQDQSDNIPNCQICMEKFSLLNRKRHCRRCGALVCVSCANRKRVLKNQTPHRVCDCCRLEMDLTTVDDLRDHFRVIVRVEAIHGLNSLHRLDPDDRKDPVSRAYFSLAQDKQRIESSKVPLKRGPSSIGHEATFMIPVGHTTRINPVAGTFTLTSSCTKWILRVNLERSGEIGMIELDMQDILSHPDIVHESHMTNQYKVSITDPKIELGSVPLMVGIYFEILSPPALWGDVAASPKVFVSNEAASPFVDRKSWRKSRMSSNTSVLDRSDSFMTADTTTPLTKISDFPNNEPKTIVERLSRFDNSSTKFQRWCESYEAALVTVNASLPLPSSSEFFNRDVSGSLGDLAVPEVEELTSAGNKKANSSSSLSIFKGGVKDDQSSRTRVLSLQLLQLYERAFVKSPSLYTLHSVLYLYADVIRKFNIRDDQYGRLIRKRAEGFRRLPEVYRLMSQSILRFYISPLPEKNLIFEASSSLQQEQDDVGINSSSLDEFNTISGPLLFPWQISEVAGYHVVEDTGSSLLYESIREKMKTHQVFIEILMQKKLQKSGNVSVNRGNLMKDLLISERLYVENLRILDEVFVTPFMHIAHGASVKNMRMSQKFGTGVSKPNNSLHSSLPKFAKKNENFPGVTEESLASTNYLSFLRSVSQSKAIAEIIRLPDVTVLLQSVRQIRTVNAQLLKDLEARLSPPEAEISGNNNDGDIFVDSEKNIGDIFTRFAVVLKVYNSYAINYPTVASIVQAALSKPAPVSAATATVNVIGKLIPKSLRFGLGALGGAATTGTSVVSGVSSSAAGSLLLNSAALSSDSKSKTREFVFTGKAQALEGFGDLIVELERSCNPMKLKQLLNLPLERFARYKRILTALLIHTPADHADIEPLRTSIKLLDQSNDHISGTRLRRENLERLQLIEKSLIGMPSGFKLVDPSRWAVREGVLIKRCRREDKVFRFWLFSDCIIYAAAKATGGTFQFHRQLLLNETAVRIVRNVRPRESAQGKGSGTDDTNTTFSTGQGMIISSNNNSALGDHQYALQISNIEKSFVVMIPNILYESWSYRASVEANSSAISMSNSAASSSSSNKRGSTLSSLKKRMSLDLMTTPSSIIAGTSTSSTNNDTSSSSVEKQFGTHLATAEEKQALLDAWYEDIVRSIANSGSSGIETIIDNSRTKETSKDDIEEANQKMKNLSTAPVWDADDTAAVCPVCNVNKFTVLRRRHHCRKCGVLCCGPCSKNKLVLENINNNRPSRVCDPCWNAARIETP